MLRTGSRDRLRPQTLEAVMCPVREEVPACFERSLHRARCTRTGIAVAAFVVAMIPQGLVADERVDAAAVAAIIAEAQQSSEAAELFYELTDRLGPRLAFTTIKDFRHYDVRTRHTNADFADAVDVEDLRQSAIVLAVVAWHAAMRDDAIPRLSAPRSP
jgi:hypothetical protein